MVSANRHVLDAFRHAGAVIAEYPRKVLDMAIEAVIPAARIPEVLTPPFLAKVGVKWVVGGGVAALAATLGPAGALAGLAAPVVIRAFDP
jgi:hypothetical protein